ncbi:ras and EF-hand domain-containing protein isoform X1 [Micropterus dolomieu]|uniref:ras and EF-hand domain-containing protein isoform X1 n=1 Tax=Micropterus dolomieu TaxID=147949 RepID=UPI001E8DE739|nr:ras and EF-hand domain-containing protein isoform X1 [Micropterus dolomieu]XP_045894105.1 ras and EF-hand domain-containing protein isoform X1 [Micropterus dolomieu]
MDRPSLRRLFSACDVDKSGKIEYEDFTVVCRELNVPESEIKTLFDKFDADEDGCIDYNKFSSRFQEVSETMDLASFGAGSSQTQGCPWEEFVGRVDAESLLSESLREQLADLYQAIHSSANTSLLPQYEEIVHSLISQSLENRLECEQLETSLKRAEEMNNSQLTELEDDIQQQLRRTEERVRDEEQKKMEGILATMRRKYENEVTDLHATVDRLLNSQKDSDLNQSKEEVVRLNKQIRDLSQENEQLRASLLQAETNIAVLHAELDKLKNMYADQKAQHRRETDDLRRMVVEYQSYSNQIQVLQETNKKLYDSNDGLRSALASEAVKRRLSPQNEIPARRMKPLRQSTLNHGSSEPDSSKTTYFHVATWADRYLDSGVSMAMDTAESAGSDYDSDDSRSTVETVHHSYSYVPSDVEISEVKSEAAVSVAPSRASSIASSLRRRLSAFSTKPLETGIEETEDPGPMYRLVLAGDAGAGKSSFLLRLTLNEFRGDIQTTLGVDFQIKRMLVDGEKTSLQIWDTAGQERFRSIARSYFRKAHGVLLLYDVTSESSFLNVRAWVDQIQDSTDEKIPMCVIGNKVDLREQLPEGSSVSSLHGEKLAKAYGALFCETSAKEGTNIVEAVLHLAREVKKNVTLRRQSDSQVRLSPSNPKKTLNACCGL